MGKIKKANILAIIMCLIISIIYLSILSKKIMPSLMNYSKIQLKRIGMEVLRDAGSKEVNEYLEGKELFVVTKNKSDEIESIDFNTAVINNASNIVSENVQQRLNEIEKGINMPEELYFEAKHKKIKNGIIYMVPLSFISSNLILFDLGPKIPMRIKYSGNVGIDIKSKISKYGINSALIEIYLNVEVTQRVYLPFCSNDMKLDSQIPIIMKIIKGNVNNFNNHELLIN